ncbi:beta-galactosidase 11-like [Nymphaea colorata]|nr:beta-galactosidase 11-like [Nymphaea colorata]
MSSKRVMGFKVFFVVLFLTLMLVQYSQGKKHHEKQQQQQQQQEEEEEDQQQQQNQQQQDQQKQQDQQQEQQDQQQQQQDQQQQDQQQQQQNQQQQDQQQQQQNQQQQDQQQQQQNQQQQDQQQQQQNQQQQDQQQQQQRGVTYDGRSLIINGKRELLFSGSIHYPRSTPDMWPDLIAKAKHGGINLIQTYVFWNIHEPVQGQFQFGGRYDVIKFIKEIQRQGLYVTLRIGPFVEAEWNYGGFPYWLREVEGIIFRSDNAPFKFHMKKFSKMIVKMMKKENLFASQGGPIVLAQIENEYDNVKLAYRQSGIDYVQWAGKMAVSLGTGVPWIMCKEKDAPDPVINTCNGRNCGDTFSGPNTPNKPALWTENWTAQYRVFGDPPSQRSAEDLAFSVARFFSKNGTHINYYMYHGGTNFGRTASSFVTTCYYDEAPLDEYGLVKGPKWGHLRDLHSALRLCRKALLWGSPSVISLGDELEARVYETSGSKVCSAFLINNHTREAATLSFRGRAYYMPPHSISILPDCNTVVFNTAKVNAQHNSRIYKVSVKASKNKQWEMFQEDIPEIEEVSITSTTFLEHLNMTKDTTDYMWHTTYFDVGYNDLPTRSDIRPVLQIASLGHALHAFINDRYIGTGHGTNVDKTFSFAKPAPLQRGRNKISILGMTVGLPDNGAYLEHRVAGLNLVTIQGLNSGAQYLTQSRWGYQVGLNGEKLKIYDPKKTDSVHWSDAGNHINQPVTWYKKYFDAPSGRDPVALNLTSMGKGQAWINGENIGRYWASYLSPLGKPTQSLYHIPRSFLKPTGNLLVLFEETGGDPYKITVETVAREIICSFVSEGHPPHVRSWERKEAQIRAIATEDLKPMVNLKCDNHKIIQSIEFVSFGNPLGICGNFTLGDCDAPSARSVVEKACLGKTACNIPTLMDTFGKDPCPGNTKTLAIQAKCGSRSFSA